MRNDKNLVFFAPYHGIGGVGLLFLRLANYLIQQNPALNIYLIDYLDGCMLNTPTDQQLHLITYQDGRCCQIPDNSLLIMQSTVPWVIPKALKMTDKTRILYWNAHPANLIPHLPLLNSDWMLGNFKWGRRVISTFLPIQRQTMVKLIDYLDKKNSLLFMSNPCIDTAQNLLKTTIKNPIKLPIFIENKTQFIRIQPSTQLTFSFLGRLIDWKIYPLTFFLKALSNYCLTQQVKIHFLVIGEGEHDYLLKEPNYNNAYLIVEFVGNVAPSALDDYLLDNVDLMLASGTSALESAKLGIPTISLGHAYHPVKQYFKVEFFFEVEANEPIMQCQSQEFEKTLHYLCFELRSNYQQLSKDCYLHYMELYDVDTISQRFLTIADKAQATYGDFKTMGFLEDKMYNSYTFLKNILTPRNK